MTQLPAKATPAALVGRQPRIAVVVPCYKVSAHIEGVVRDIGPWCWRIFCVDDACPAGSGDYIEQNISDPRVVLVRRKANGGVGAAVLSGYQAAIEAGADILVKVDGDGQMDPSLVPLLVRPIVMGQADYVKGNRFYSADVVAKMPRVRLIGNAGLSFMTKLSSGYWDLMDPTNGFTAIDARVASLLPWDRLHPRYFFESDMLCRLAILRARVVELPMTATYGEEQSNLSEMNALLTFPFLHARNFGKRIVYNYFLRDFSVASLWLLAGGSMTMWGLAFGVMAWIRSSLAGEPATAGTVMLAALPLMLGIQLILSFMSHDIAMTPRIPLSDRLAAPRED